MLNVAATESHAMAKTQMERFCMQCNRDRMRRVMNVQVDCVTLETTNSLHCVTMHHSVTVAKLVHSKMSAKSIKTSSTLHKAMDTVSKVVATDVLLQPNDAQFKMPKHHTSLWQQFCSPVFSLKSGMVRQNCLYHKCV